MSQLDASPAEKPRRRRFRISGMKAIALFEGTKAILFLFVGFGLFSLIDHDVSAAATYLVKHARLNPASRYPHIFIDLASHVSNAELWMLAVVAFADAIIRGVEAIGLWWEREWGKWLGVVTASIYFPFEIYEMWRHVTWLKTAAFLTNVLIVAYLGYILYASRGKPSSRLERIEIEPL